MAILMEETMRWFGPSDPVTLTDIRQAGCTGVVTALHQVPIGEVWPIADIRERQQLIEAAGMTWKVVESLPVSEDIKRGAGAYQAHINNYVQSLRHLAGCGLEVITYNFMPVLDWVRTDVDYVTATGAKALYFERVAYMAFDLYLLQRPGAAADYTEEEVAAADNWLRTSTPVERERLFNNLLLGLPGSDGRFTIAEVNRLLQQYHGISRQQLFGNLVYFLEQVVPVAEQLHLRLAIHPDDPPYPVLGLPRIVSTEADIAALINAVPSMANGFCYCTGSLGVRPGNNLVGMIERFGRYIHFIHLRNTRRDVEGNFWEADHLDGDTDMYGVVKALMQLQHQRAIALPMRPDHGHRMLDDLQKKTYPGYSAIGRLKGLAELRGLQRALARELETQTTAAV